MKILKTVIIVAILLGIGMLAFAYSGIYNIAADVPHTTPIRWLLETTRTQSIARRDDSVKAPDELGSMQHIQSGAKSYAAMCAICHLGPGIEPTPLHTGLNPQPPRLQKEMGHHSPENLFWILKHGIKMTGMPAWGGTHSGQELWEIVAFLKKLPEMSSQQYKELTSNTGGNDGAGHTHGGGESAH